MTAIGLPGLSESEPTGKPFLVLRFFRNGYMEWETNREVQPTEYIELKAFAGTIALILHQLMDWAGLQMRLLMARQVLEKEQGDPLMRFLENWTAGEEKH